MAISKKQAKQIAELINSCMCWTTAVRDELAKKDFDSQRARRLMGYHDRDGATLNTILGQEAVVLYYKETV